MIPWILCVVFLIFIFLLWGKLLVLHRSLKELSTEFRERLQEDTNHLIYLSFGDTYVKKLAAEMNEELKELRKQRLKYLQGDRELKEAVTNISHDLRTPLTAVYGYLELLEEEEVSEEVGQYLKQIHNRADALKRLTEELFRYSVIVTEEEEGEKRSGIESGFRRSFAGKLWRFCCQENRTGNPDSRRKSMQNVRRNSTAQSAG